MNQFVPDWNTSMGGSAFAPLGEDDGLIELLWCNGHVVMQSQAPRKPPRPEKTAAAAAAMPEDETATWFQYPVDDVLEKDLFSELFGEMTAAAGDVRRAACKEEPGAVTAFQSRMMPPPWPAREKEEFVDVDDVCGVSEVVVAQTDGEVKVAAAAAVEAAGESSMLTIGSSICGSNHVQTPPGSAPPRPLGNGKAGAARTTTVASSSMRSRSCAAKTEPHVAAAGSGKRKQRDAAMESGSPSEDVEFESAAVTCEPAQKTTTAKRRRAAEVHNLSERRRRDRINEKMKALQELIPHCNKMDKASMLDEAIEYLKSLQLQLQMMWMSSGMTPPAVMFPAAGVHQYMQRMGAVGMGPPHMASLPRMPPFMAPPAAVQSSPVSHMPAVSMAEPYARCLAVDHLQPPSPMHYLQGMSIYQLASAKNLQQQQQNTAVPPPAGSLPPGAPAQALTPDDILHKKYGV
ncbi:hypothetical protein E2562_023675 [Oryza meyeriana var. granulata]|uniref:BHLH domain-containing protein n=1 Tax=Oryza meyeriana var. granulata TaxID=110450 RepID=A0A6G1BNP2_9ORYZ|nr:hypothetical protein E2562_023675 [Oryza meyeriana var. granulata]KAF0889377.1 hypothetical protein E2562_023675 [Oryza meyeriana var. granulata]